MSEKIEGEQLKKFVDTDTTGIKLINIPKQKKDIGSIRKKYKQAKNKKNAL